MTTEKPLVKILLFYGPVPGCARHSHPCLYRFPPARRRVLTQAGGLNMGVQTGHSERVSPIISAVLIAGWIARFREDRTGGV